MENLRVAAKLCENENDLTFKEKFEIARLLEKLCVTVVEFPELSDGKEDALLLRTFPIALQINQPSAIATPQSPFYTFYMFYTAKHLCALCVSAPLR